MADIRTLTVPAIWAANAQTTIPEPPVTGQSYRQANPSPDDWRFGQAYDTLADSARWNEILYIVTTFLTLLEQNGVLPYSQSTNYNTGALCIGVDNTIYQALQPSGPANGGSQATSNTAYWKKPLVQVSYSGSSTITVPTNGGAISLKIDPAGGLGVSSSGLFVNPEAFSTDLINELLTQLRLPKWLTANTTFYIRADGNDNNDGSADTAAKAFRTAQACLNYISSNYNLGNYSITIQIGAGEGFGGVVLPKYSASTGTITIIGAGKDSTKLVNSNGAGVSAVASAGTYFLRNLRIEGTKPSTGASGAVYIAVSGVRVDLRNCSVLERITITNPAGQVCGIGALNGGSVYIQAVEAAPNETVDITMVREVTTTASIYLLWADSGGQIRIAASGVYTGDVAYTAIAQNLAVIQRGVNYTGQVVALSGTMTGRRYFVESNAIINTRGMGADFFPGSIAGSTPSSGGQYL